VYGSVTAAEELADGVAQLVSAWHTRAGRPRRDSAAAQLIERLPEHPVIGIADAASLAHVSRQAARLAVDRLVTAGVLREVTGKRRLRRWEAVALLALLDGLEAGRAGRRRRRLATDSP
jgi:hypothetical protein